MDLMIDMQDLINDLPRERRDRVGVAFETQGKIFRSFHARYPSGYRRKIRTFHEIGYGLVKEICALGKPSLLWSKHYPWIDLEDVRMVRRDAMSRR
jgi:hypothetical protein